MERGLEETGGRQLLNPTSIPVNNRICKNIIVGAVGQGSNEDFKHLRAKAALGIRFEL